VNTTATTLSPPVLAARDIRKSYGKGTARFDALAGVSLSVYAGESIAIVGKSGSGKSTLMHLLALLDQPDDGTLSVRQLNRLRNQDFGFVFQQSSSPPTPPCSTMWCCP
jgi:putative ABC transport system ATP-binding protein